MNNTFLVEMNLLIFHYKDQESDKQLFMFGIYSVLAFSLSVQKLNSPTLSVNSEGFIPMLSKLDDCIEYVSSHVSTLQF